jgi:hypothetical protein
MQNVKKTIWFTVRRSKELLFNAPYDELASIQTDPSLPAAITGAVDHLPLRQLQVKSASTTFIWALESHIFTRSFCLRVFGIYLTCPMVTKFTNSASLAFVSLLHVRHFLGMLLH